MRLSIPGLAFPLGKQRTSAIGRAASDERGTTAIEFAAVIGPFLFLLFGIMSVGFYFFVTFSLEHAVETTSRVIRTGQAQTAATPMTGAAFKTLLCTKLPPFMNCDGTGNKVRINVQTFTDYTGAAASCLDNSGALITTANQSYSTGGASAVVLVTACYEWELSQPMTTILYWIAPAAARMASGSTLVQASTTFTTEPYN